LGGKQLVILSAEFGHSTQATPTLGSFYGPDAVGVRHLCLCQIWGRYLYSFKCYKGVPKFRNLVTWPRPRPTRGRFFGPDAAVVRQCQIWSGYLYSFKSYKVGTKISKFGHVTHVTQATPTWGRFVVRTQ